MHTRSKINVEDFGNSKSAGFAESPQQVAVVEFPLGVVQKLLSLFTNELDRIALKWSVPRPQTTPSNPCFDAIQKSRPLDGDEKSLESDGKESE